MMNARLIVTAACVLTASVSLAQNSPYTRYGLGDVLPHNNIVNRGMAGISAAYTERTSVNFSNPASYSNFFARVEGADKKVSQGLVILDAGINLESRTLREPSNPNKFTSTDAYFSYLQIGIPIRPKWGISFGLKPVTRIGYQVAENSRLSGIDSIHTEYNGNGGLFLPTIGTGFAIKDFSVGLNFGYLFGRRENVSNRAIRNDSIPYYFSTHQEETSFGNVFFNAGAQYKIDLSKTTVLRLGASGNLKTDISASQDRTVGTFLADPSGRLIDTAFSSRDNKGEITYPASYTVGFVVERALQPKQPGWLIGLDLQQTKWSQYRNFGAADAVQDNWDLKVGGHFQPVTGRPYFSKVTYRFGFHAGTDYVTAGGDMKTWGISSGLGLPLINWNRLSQSQFTIINLAFEYNKRGNNSNIVKEDLFRLSVGLNFSDLWFNKRKYD